MTNKNEKILFYLDELEKIITVVNEYDNSNKNTSDKIKSLKLKNDEFLQLIDNMTSVIRELKNKNKLLEERIEILTKHL